jgi:hypothetical protein
MLIQRSLKSWLCGILIITFTWLGVFAVATQPSFAFSQADVDKLTATKTCLKCDLSNANLSKANLSKANLFLADLSGADLSGADLSNANLTNANLTNADLTNADLTNANMTGAKIPADLNLARFSVIRTDERREMEREKERERANAKVRRNIPSGYTTGRKSPNSAQVRSSSVSEETSLVYEKVCIDEFRGSLFKQYCRVPDGGCRNPGPLSPGEYLVNCLCRGTGELTKYFYTPTRFPSVSEFKEKCDPAP